MVNYFIQPMHPNRQDHVMYGRGIADKLGGVIKVGGTLYNAGKGINNFLKDTKLVSNGLALAGKGSLAVAAQQMGYGVRKRRAAGKKAAATRAKNHAVRVRAGKKAARTRKRHSIQSGKGIINDLGSGIGNAAFGIGRGLFS